MSLLAKAALGHDHPDATDDYINQNLALMYLCLGVFEVGSGKGLGYLYDKFGI